MPACGGVAPRHFLAAALLPSSLLEGCSLPTPPSQQVTDFNLSRLIEDSTKTTSSLAALNPR